LTITINFFNFNSLHNVIMIKFNKSNYNKTLKSFARKLRNDSTKGEIILWKEVLSSRKMYGLQFLRQYPIDNYILDFVCRRLQLVIEVDGYSHNDRYDHDLVRDGKLKELGFTTLRIDEQEVYNDLNNVILVIEGKVLVLLQSIPPTPFAKGE
jgi:very-short-patch-repair endonuclease